MGEEVASLPLKAGIISHAAHPPIQVTESVAVSLPLIGLTQMVRVWGHYRLEDETFQSFEMLSRLVYSFY